METKLVGVYYRVFSFAFARAYLTTMRPYLLFVSGITGTVGLSFVPDPSTLLVVSVFAASFFSYGFGQALTDCFQMDTDSLSAPYRPLTKGIVGKKQVLLVSIIGLTCCVSVFTIYNPLNFVLGLLAGLGLATYTIFKRKWWAGPLYNAWIVVVLCLMAFHTGRGAKVTGPVLWMLAAVFFGYANFVLAGYFKDIGADKATGYNTLPVVYGRRVAGWISHLFAVLSVVTSFVAISQSAFGSQTISGLASAIMFASAGTIASLVAQIRLHSTNRDEEAHRAISAVVHSYILLLSAITCSQKTAWWPFLVIFYAAFELVLKIRPEKNQI
jgi:4-hydroxybenzoate polyprenyltransferase